MISARNSDNTLGHLSDDRTRCCSRDTDERYEGIGQSSSYLLQTKTLQSLVTWMQLLGKYPLIGEVPDFREMLHHLHLTALQLANRLFHY